MAFSLVFSSKNDIDRIALYGFILTLFLGYLLFIYGAYLQKVLRAAQGEYFYPIIPLILLSASIILMRLRIL